MHYVECLDELDEIQLEIVNYKGPTIKYFYIDFSLFKNIRRAGVYMTMS